MQNDENILYLAKFLNVKITSSEWNEQLTYTIGTPGKEIETRELGELGQK